MLPAISEILGGIVIAAVIGYGIYYILNKNNLTYKQDDERRGE